MSLRRQIIKEKFGNSKTKTGWYLLPVLGHIPFLKPKGLYLREQLGEHLIDIYVIDDKDSPKLVLIFDLMDEDDDFIFEKLQMDHTFIEANEDKDSGEMWFIHNIPNEFKKDYQKFKEGKYSEFSGKLTDRLMNAHGKIKAEGFTKLGLPAVSIFESLFPDQNQDKKKILAEHLDVNVNLIEELLSIPDMKFESFKSIKELKKQYAGSNS